MWFFIVVLQSTLLAFMGYLLTRKNRSPVSHIEVGKPVGKVDKVSSRGTKNVDRFVIGHRGMGVVGVDGNTFSAFHLAAETGLDFETDLWLTNDGYIIIHHGPEFPGTGDIDVGRLTLKETRAKVLGPNNGERIPLLSDMLQICCTHPSLVITLELKGAAWTIASIKRIGERLKKYKMFNRVKFSSFHHPNLLVCKEALPAIPRACLFNWDWDTPVPPDVCEIGKQYGASELHCRYSQLTLEIVNKIRKEGFGLMCFFGGNQDDTFEELEAMIDMGVTAICTNRPDRLHSILNKLRRETAFPRRIPAPAVVKQMRPRSGSLSPDAIRPVMRRSTSEHSFSHTKNQPRSPDKRPSSMAKAISDDVSPYSKYHSIKSLMDLSQLDSSNAMAINEEQTNRAAKMQMSSLVADSVAPLKSQVRMSKTSSCPTITELAQSSVAGRER